MATTSELSRYETAQETLLILAAVAALVIEKEKIKPMPDSNIIGELEKDFKLYMALHDALPIDDNDRIEYVISQYGPIAKELLKINGDSLKDRAKLPTLRGSR